MSMLRAQHWSALPHRLQLSEYPRNASNRTPAHHPQLDDNQWRLSLPTRSWSVRDTPEWQRPRVRALPARKTPSMSARFSAYVTPVFLADEAPANFDPHMTRAGVPPCPRDASAANDEDAPQPNTRARTTSNILVRATFLVNHGTTAPSSEDIKSALKCILVWESA